MHCPSAFRHHIHRETLESITQTLHTRWTSGIRTQIGKIKAHNHFLGNDHADALANQLADEHPPDTTHDTSLDLSNGTWTWPYTLIHQPQGEPTPYMYTNLKSTAHKPSIKHNYSPFPTPPNTAPYLPKPPPTGRISHSTTNTPPSPTFY
jgi:hypothetical protein